MPLFLTPPSLPEGRECRTLELPTSLEWLAVFNTALALMQRPYNWEQVHDTDMTPDEAIEVCRQVMENYLETSTLECEDTVPTPFWDDAADVDDEASMTAQDWYGEVTNPDAAPAELTFVDNAAIWVFTGLVAYAGGIGAAVVYHTIAPRFALAWKRGDLGELIRVVIDAADYGTVDTGTVDVGEIVTIDVLTDESLETHDIMLIKVG